MGVENALRRRNHLGLAVGLLGALAKASLAAGGSLTDSVTLWDKSIADSKERMRVRVKKRREMLTMAGKGGKVPDGWISITCNPTYCLECRVSLRSCCCLCVFSSQKFGVSKS